MGYGKLLLLMCIGKSKNMVSYTIEVYHTTFFSLTTKTNVVKPLVFLYKVFKWNGNEL